MTTKIDRALGSRWYNLEDLYHRYAPESDFIPSPQSLNAGRMKFIDEEEMIIKYSRN